MREWRGKDRILSNFVSPQKPQSCGRAERRARRVGCAEVVGFALKALKVVGVDGEAVIVADERVLAIAEVVVAINEVAVAIDKVAVINGEGVTGAPRCYGVPRTFRLGGKNMYISRA